MVSPTDCPCNKRLAQVQKYITFFKKKTKQNNPSRFLESRKLRKKLVQLRVFPTEFKTILYCMSAFALEVGQGEGRALSPDRPVRGQLLGKTGLVREGVVGENRVIARGAGGVGVGTGGRVLLEWHGQVQILICGGHR